MLVLSCSDVLGDTVRVGDVQNVDFMDKYNMGGNVIGNIDLGGEVMDGLGDFDLGH